MKHKMIPNKKENATFFIDCSKAEEFHRAMIYIDESNGNSYKLLSKYSKGRIQYIHYVEQPDGFISALFRGIVDGWTDYFAVRNTINQSLQTLVYYEAKLIDAEPQFRVLN